MFGVWHGPPNALAAPKPTSSIRINSTFGAPAGGRIGTIGGYFVSGSLASYVVRLTAATSGIGRTDRDSEVSTRTRQPPAMLGPATVAQRNRRQLPAGSAATRSFKRVRYHAARPSGGRRKCAARGQLHASVRYRASATARRRAPARMTEAPVLRALRRWRTVSGTTRPLSRNPGAGRA